MEWYLLSEGISSMTWNGHLLFHYILHLTAYLYIIYLLQPQALRGLWFSLCGSLGTLQSEWLTVFEREQETADAKGEGSDSTEKMPGSFAQQAHRRALNSATKENAGRRAEQTHKLALGIPRQAGLGQKYYSKPVAIIMPCDWSPDWGSHHSCPNLRAIPCVTLLFRQWVWVVNWK